MADDPAAPHIPPSTSTPYPFWTNMPALETIYPFVALPMADEEHPAAPIALSFPPSPTPSPSPSTTHSFWRHQPVLQGPGSTALKDTRIKSPNSLTKFLHTTQPPLPPDLQWASIDLNIDRSFSKLDSFLSRHFFDSSEDNHNNNNAPLNFPFSRDFLRWLLRCPGHINSLHVAIRDKKTKKLLGFIAGTPATFRFRTAVRASVIAHLLCVHKTRRSHGLAPLLIHELARRAAAQHIWHGVFATEARVPTPLCSCEWLQRLLKPKKLRRLGYPVRKDRKRKRTVEIQSLPREPQTPGFRRMRRRDVPAVFYLLREQLRAFAVAPVVDERFVAHFLVPKEGLVESYVVEDLETRAITDFCSFVVRRQEVKKERRWWVVKCAVLFYYAASKTCLLTLIRDLVAVARREGYDVFRAQGVMGNDLFLDKIKFEAVAEKKVLHYHLYNYGLMNLVMPKELGLVIL